MAARQRQGRGERIALIDKAATVGGRLATWRVGPGLADSGAQFFTVRDATFQRYVDQWQADGLVYAWSMGWSDGSLVASTLANDGYPRYAVHGGAPSTTTHPTRNCSPPSKPASNPSSSAKSSCMKPISNAGAMPYPP